MHVKDKPIYNEQDHQETKEAAQQSFPSKGASNKELRREILDLRAALERLQGEHDALQTRLAAREADRARLISDLTDALAAKVILNQELQAVKGELAHLQERLALIPLSLDNHLNFTQFDCERLGIAVQEGHVCLQGASCHVCQLGHPSKPCKD